MLKIFWDKDNIAFIGDRVSSERHSHCLLQLFLSFDAPLQLNVEDNSVCGKCVIVNKNVVHEFSCGNIPRLSILIEPTSSFSNALTSKIDGSYFVCDKDGIELLQQNAVSLINSTDTAQYVSFVRELAEYLGVERNEAVMDERIAELLSVLQNCDCYDHTIESFAEKLALSSSRLSHLFREQVGVPLKSYITFHQLGKAFTAVLNGKSVTDAAMLAGFDSPSHFAATVKKWMGTNATTTVKNSEFLKVFM